MTLRKVFLKLHLYLGLVSALFLIVLGLTGSVLAFESHLDRWMNPSLWYVTPGIQTLPEAQLIQTVEQSAAPAHVAMVYMPRHANWAQMMVMAKPGAGTARGNPRTSPQVFINPYTGTILGRREGVSGSQKFMQWVEQLHVSLLFGKFGEPIVSVATLILFVEVLFGLYLWLYTRRTSIKWDASWLRISFDAHNVMGLYAGLFIFISALTGVLMGLSFARAPIYKITHSEPLRASRPAESTPIAGTAPITVDQALAIAHEAVPDSISALLQLPAGPKSSYNISMRVPQEVSDGVYSGAVIDQYSGQVLQRRDYRTGSAGYRVMRIVRALHTGDIYGLPSHLIMSIASLLLVVMVFTGVVIWWKKLAI